MSNEAIQHDIGLKPTKEQIYRIKKELRDEILIDMGIVDKHGNPDAYEFRSWWLAKKKWEDRAGKIAIALFITVATLGLSSLASWIGSKVHWK